MRYVLYILIYCWIANASSAQPQNDLAGWGQLKWGMSQNEVLALYPKAHEKTVGYTIENKYIVYVVEGFTDGKDTFEVNFGFDSSSKRLENVTLIYQDQDIATYNTIGAELESKYGTPIMDTSATVYLIAKNKQWLLPRTKLHLLFIEFMSTVMISYQDAQWFLSPDSLYFDGWRGAQWGMSEQELQSAFPRLKKRPEPIFYFDGQYTYGDIDSQTVFGSAYDVRFTMDSATRSLKSVTLSHVNPHIVAFKDAREKLIKQFGKPTRESDLFSSKAFWEYPKTKIELRYSDLFDESVRIEFSER